MTEIDSFCLVSTDISTFLIDLTVHITEDEKQREIDLVADALKVV